MNLSKNMDKVQAEKYFAKVNYTLIFCLLAIAFAFAQQKQRLAVLPSVGELEPQRLNNLTDKVREIASKTLPMNDFLLLRQEAVIEMIGNEEYFIACKEGTCIGELAKKANANYGARCDVFKVADNLALKFELYSVKDEAILETFTDYNVPNFFGMLEILEERLPSAFRKMTPRGLRNASSHSVQSGIGNIETVGVGMLEVERSYLVNLSTNPQGAILSFNGTPIGNCSKTPCKVELPEGNIRIVAALEEYETIDTTVSIRQNNQNINIKLKANFGTLEIKPNYKDNIGSNKQWNLSINNKSYSYFKNRFSPGNYEVKLSHECYEDISFNVGINKDKSEVFDMLKYLNLKQGILILKAEKDGEPVSEPVFANGKRIGETPFSGTVPVCAEIGIENSKNKVDVKILHGQTVRHKVNVSNIRSKEHSRINFGLGGIISANQLEDDNKIYKDKINEADTTKNDTPISFSLGLASKFLFTNYITLHPEFYYTYRVFRNEQCFQDCTKIVEHAIEIPLSIKLDFFRYNDIFTTLFYLEAGILFGIPLKTTVYTSSTYIDRKNYDFGYIFGLGINLLHYMDLGTRIGINTSDFTKDVKGSSWFAVFTTRVWVL